MAERYFTPEEANAALERVRPLAEELVAQRRALVEAEGRKADFDRRIAGNGEALDASDLVALEARITREAAEVASCIVRLQDQGVLVKDLDRGLVDFPAKRGDEDVLLCWELGEAEIAYWHGLDEGYAGRKPLPL